MSLNKLLIINATHFMYVWSNTECITTSLGYIGFWYVKDPRSIEFVCQKFPSKNLDKAKSKNTY